MRGSRELRCRRSTHVFGNRGGDVCGHVANLVQRRVEAAVGEGSVADLVGEGAGGHVEGMVVQVRGPTGHGTEADAGEDVGVVALPWVPERSVHLGVRGGASVGGRGRAWRANRERGRTSTGSKGLPDAKMALPSV